MHQRSNIRLVLIWTLLLSVYCQELVFVGDVDEEDSKVEEATVVEEPSRETFVPTNEWQEIKPGQAIPRGLHVRMDMQTGKKEARLMQVCYGEGAQKTENDFFSILIVQCADCAPNPKRGDRVME